MLIKSKIALLVFLGMVGTNAALAEEPTRVPALHEAFELDVVCQQGSSHVFLTEKEGLSDLEIGSIRRDRVEQAPGGSLLNMETRTALVNEIMTTNSVYNQIAICQNLAPVPHPDEDAVATCSNGICVCYPLQHCALFEYLCTLAGGTIQTIEESPTHIGHKMCFLPRD
jgi:hypothetical protein